VKKKCDKTLQHITVRI